MNDDQTLAVEAVSLVAEYLRGLKLTPEKFSAQIALCQLLKLADEDPASNVAQWILATPREGLWKTDRAGKFVDGDDPKHVRFRDAWEEFCLNELPPM